MGNKRLIIFFISVFTLIFIVGLSRSIYTLWQKHSLVADREVVLREKDEENKKLQKQLALVQSPEFIEEAARDKLNLSREGEVIVVLPKQAGTQPAAVQPQSSAVWQQWFRLFF